MLKEYGGVSFFAQFSPLIGDFIDTLFLLIRPNPSILLIDDY